MKGIYTYIPETNYVPREYSVVGILLLLFMVLISLVPVLNLLYFHYYYYYFCNWLSGWLLGVFINKNIIKFCFERSMVKTPGSFVLQKTSARNINVSKRGP